MLKRFIKRPVLSTVISIIIVTLGILGIAALPVSQYPEIAPPTIQVSANYTGANADVVLKSVVTPLEQMINGVQDMDYMTSTSGNDGSASIQVVFKTGTNPDIDAVNTQNLVSRATSQLPQEVVRSGITVRKRQPSDLLVFSIYSDNPVYDQTFLQNYADINLVPEIKRISGVGDAIAAGTMDYAMRIWLKPDVMASYGLVPADITAALAEQNLQAAPGQFGEQGKQSFQYIIKYKGTLADTTEFGNIIIRSVGTKEHVLRLKDVARLELGAQSYATGTRTNGLPAVSITVMQAAGSNASDIINQALAVVKNAAKSFPPGVKYVVLSNANDFLNASIDKVLHTLVEAFILVFFVVFVFLQDLRSTLIPAIAVPVAIVGTFFFLNLFGFTINLLTLFALILAIGIVVDDAIVVVEAVHAKIDQGYTSARKASIDAMDEISGAIVSITLVMAAVFVPVSFISGSAGVFYKQFGLTLAIAIILSAVNALTLSPALCALFLKPHAKTQHHSWLQRFYTAFNTSFDTMTRRYRSSVAFLARKKWIPFLALLFFTAVLGILLKTTSTAFVPNEDLGVITADVTLPAAASLERTAAVNRQLENIAKTIPEINNVVAITGSGATGGSGSNYGKVTMRLVLWNQRKRSIQAIIDELFQKTAGITEAKINFFAPPTIQGFGSVGGFSLQLQDKTGGNIVEFNKVCTDFLNALNARPEIQFASTPFDPGYPQYMFNVDVAKAKDAGFQVDQILNVMQGYFGGIYASNFNQFGQQFRVMIQAEPNYRAKPENLNSVYVRSPAGTMAPITAFATLQPTYGPQTISRFNLFTSIAISGTPKPGYSSGSAITAIREVAAQVLPPGYGYEFSGLSRQEISAGGQTGFIFLLCLIFVYFLLCAQYESYILPLSILLTLPIGLAGAFIFTGILGINNNIYVQITLIMLIGLLAKNAILIVEFALERRRRGMDILQAALEGANARLRPILMTSFAFTLGLVPLMIATGAGANGNRSIGTGAVGGMLIGTIFGVFITPILFILFQTLQEKVSGPPKADDDDDE
ncbi:efflux RND transporter permease subunit [Chitinophaga sp. HK235]|uniref:efflux RND transporter permease subunit n=1 Tax=Chitinophaga sp. HK235 TaxID=2952571 RepID=UPI001BA97250|nr:efflux RND transporter permease subunit [Chitinophaga sp. HK235]